MRLFYSVCAVFLIAFTIHVSARAGTTAAPSAGALGDSLADEYQFADDPPDRQAARNFVELLAENGRLNFGAFSTVARPEPRRQGYAFNWARSGARTSDLPAQAAGLAQQAAAGQVQLGFIIAGANDFRDILSGADPTTTVSKGVANTAAAVQVLLASSPTIKVAVSNLPDVTRLPGAQFLLALDPALAPLLTQLSALVDTYNGLLGQQFIGNSRVAIVDMHGLFQQILANPSTIFPGVTFNTTTPGKAMSDLFVDPIHPGTLGQGLMANAFVNTIDSKFGFDIAPLTDAQIEASARAAAVPLPTAGWVMMVMAPVVVVLVRRESRRVGLRRD